MGVPPVIFSDARVGRLCHNKGPPVAAFKERGRLSSDSEVRGIVLVLVVVLVLDLWDFGAEKRARSFGNYFVPSL